MNTKIIKPIETQYRGYRFRSRLEARWAVFFDALELDWEYEPDGYVVDGVHYLPDFWIPCPKYHKEEYGTDKSGYFIEIKPLHLVSDRAIHLAQQLTILTNHITFIYSGDPVECEIFEFARNRPYLKTTKGNVLNNWNSGVIRFQMGQGLGLAGGILEAAKKARSARFEYGERP